MPSAYEALPTTYPPSHPTNPSLTSTFRTFGIFNVCHDRPDPNSVSGSRDKQRRRIGPATTLKFIILPIAFFLILHTLIISAFPSSAYSTKYASYWAGSVGKTGHSDYAAATLAADAVWSRLDPSAGQPGAFFRDSYPIRTMLAFWDLAEREVQARQVDTCRGQLGREFIDAYQRTELDYCLAPDAAGGFVPGTIRNDSLSPHWDPSIPVPPTRITCVAVQRDSFSDWWPYPAAPCLSTDLRAVREDERRFHAADCELTDDGKALKGEMGSERFLGADAELVREGTGSCKERVERTLLVVGRQDQWNPLVYSCPVGLTGTTDFTSPRT